MTWGAPDRLRSEIEMVGQELTGSLGPGGRARGASGSAERARGPVAQEHPLDGGENSPPASRVGASFRDLDQHRLLLRLSARPRARDFLAILSGFSRFAAIWSLRLPIGPSVFPPYPMSAFGQRLLGLGRIKVAEIKSAILARHFRCSGYSIVRPPDRSWSSIRRHPMHPLELWQRHRRERSGQA